MTKHLRATSSWLACGLLLCSCKIGFEPIGGEGETEAGDGDGDTGDGDGDSGDGDGDGDTGDGDGDGETGDGDGDGDSGDGDGDSGDGDGDSGDGDGDGECPPDPLSPFEVEFDYQLTIGGDPIAVVPFDQACTIAAISSGTDASLELDCNGTDVQLAFTVMPGLDLHGQVGDPVHVWLYHVGDEFSPTWLRVDFPEHNANLFVIDAELLAPQDSYFPAPWELAVVDSCGTIEDGCATINVEQMQVSFFGQTLELWPVDHGSLELSEASLGMWVARAAEVVELNPLCDPTPDFFNTHQVLISATGPAPVEGEVCQPGESDPCSTGLHCCYPCGIPDCDFVCTPEDPDTMQCPLPPP